MVPNQPDPDTSADVEINENVTFADMMLKADTLAGLTKCNFVKPSPIQLRAIPIGCCGMGKFSFNSIPC